METTTTQKKKWDWAEHKPNNIFNIEVESSIDFFKWWCTLIHPFVALTPKEIEVISSFLQQRMELSKKVPSDLVDTLLMTNEIKNKVVEHCHITHQHFYVIASALKKKGVLTEAGISPELIPNVRETDNGTFQLLILLKDQVK